MVELPLPVWASLLGGSGVAVALSAEVGLIVVAAWIADRHRNTSMPRWAVLMLMMMASTSAIAGLNVIINVAMFVRIAGAAGGQSAPSW